MQFLDLKKGPPNSKIIFGGQIKLFQANKKHDNDYFTFIFRILYQL